MQRVPQEQIIYRNQDAIAAKKRNYGLDVDSKASKVQARNLKVRSKDTDAEKVIEEEND